MKTNHKILILCLIMIWGLIPNTLHASNMSEASAVYHEFSAASNTIVMIPGNPSSLQAELDNAKKAGKAVFVVVTEAGISETAKAITMAEEAKAIYKNAIVVKIFRDDAGNEKFISEWRLTGAPVPLILVISPKGQLSGGMILAQASADKLAALVPSPKLESVYAAIGDGKNAIVAFTKKSFTDRNEVLGECQKAVTMLNNEAVFIEVDIDDPKEANFMNQMRIDKTTVKASITLVINKQGQVAGTSNSVPDAAKLASAAKTPVRGGCGPGCGPAGCGK